MEKMLTEKQYNDLKADYNNLPSETKDLNYIYKAWVLDGDGEEYQFIGGEGEDRYLHPEYIEAIKVFPNWELLEFAMLDPNPFFKRGGGNRDTEERDNLIYAHDVLHDTLGDYWDGPWNNKLLDKHYWAWKEIVDDQDYEIYKEMVE